MAEFEPTPPRDILWRRTLDDLSFELARVERRGTEIMISGLVLIAEHGEPLRVDYRIGCDAEWRTRRVEIDQSFQGQTMRLRLDQDGAGHWMADGETRPDLAGCIDVDLGVSPSTNALPVNRLSLAIGEVAEIRAAWVQFPALTVLAAAQGYERLAATRYRYRSLGSGFTAEIEIDEDGFPTDYVGIWRRIAGSPPATRLA